MIEVVAVVCILAVLAGQAYAITLLRTPVTEAVARQAPRHQAAPPPSNDPMGRVVDVLRRRRWLRRSLSFASVAIMLIAVGMIGYPFYTNLYADRRQDQLERQFASEELRQAYTDRDVQEGDSLTRIIIPAIDVDVVVVEGVSPSALRAGAGHYPSTKLPCEDGNVGIAGHRTTYGRPFHNLDLLSPGDEIILQTPIGECTYHVTEQFRTRPSDTSVIAPTPDAVLTLTTCHPKGSARERLIIRAELVSTAQTTA